MKVEKMEVEQLLLEIKKAQDDMQYCRDIRKELLKVLDATQELITRNLAEERESSHRLKYVARLHAKKASHQINQSVFPITKRK
jgi:hypothetical protein